MYKYVELLFAGALKGFMVQMKSRRKYFLSSSTVGICES